MKQSWLSKLEMPWSMLVVTGILFGLVAAFVDLGGTEWKKKRTAND